jgi:hypothetical protein
MNKTLPGILPANQYIEAPIGVERDVLRICQTSIHGRNPITRFASSARHHPDTSIRVNSVNTIEKFFNQEDTAVWTDGDTMEAGQARFGCRRTRFPIRVRPPTRYGENTL